MSTERPSMHRADKAVLRLASGLGLAVLIAYGFDFALPFVVCVMAVLVLCKPGPPLPLLKGIILAAIVAAVAVAGVLMVPVLEYYPFAGVMLTAASLYIQFRPDGGRPAAQTTILVIALTVIPIAGVAEQALAPLLAKSLALGVGTGVLVSGVTHALFPDAPGPVPSAPAAPANPKSGPASPKANRDPADWHAMRATLVVLPVFVLALTNPAFYLAAVMKSVALASQAGAATARGAGRELVGSTLVGAWVAALVWIGLSLRPNLLMLILWVVLAAFWTGARIFTIKPTSLPPSFWVNALVTMLILLGPAIEDSAGGKDVVRASAIRVCLFVGLALYAWATVWVLERWRAARADARAFNRP